MRDCRRGALNLASGGHAAVDDQIGTGDVARRVRGGTVRLTIKARPRSYTAAMPTARDPLYQRHRFPPEVISYAVWLYLWTVPAMQGLLRQSGNARLQLSIRSLTQRRC